jgi:hypothetical protein
MKAPRIHFSFRRLVAASGQSPVLALLLALTLPATSALASARADISGPVLVTGIRDGVRAGEEIELRWSGADPSIDELEILLSVDDGRHFALRVSPELDARAGRYLWRVPNLATANARLRVRFQHGGREIEGGASAAFRITPDPADAPAFAQIHEGAWWIGARESEVASAANSLAPAEASLNAAGPANAPGIVARGLSVPEPLSAPASRFVTARRVPPAAASRENPAPRVIAQRN